MKFKVAVIQMESKRFAPAENLAKAGKYVKKVSRKADVVIFPEDFITGPLGGIGSRRLKFVDFNGEYLEHFCRLAREHSIDIVPGSWIEGKGKNLYNTSYYIDHKGTVKAKYRKNNLWLSERSYISSGKEALVFKTRFGKAGLAICWDLAFPEHFRKLARKGAEIVYCPSLWYLTAKGKIIWNYAEEKHVNALCTARAFENNLVLIYCGAAGKTKKTEQALGRSQIAMPIKGAVKRLDHNKEEMFVQEIDTLILKKAEMGYRIRKGLKERVK